MPFFGIDGVGWLGSRWSGPVGGAGRWSVVGTGAGV